MDIDTFLRRDTATKVFLKAEFEQLKASLKFGAEKGEPVGDLVDYKEVVKASVLRIEKFYQELYENKKYGNLNL